MIPSHSHPAECKPTCLSIDGTLTVMLCVISQCPIKIVFLILFAKHTNMHVLEVFVVCCVLQRHYRVKSPAGFHLSLS